MGMTFAYQADGRTDLAGRAIAALERVMVDESLLDRMKRTHLAKPFDRNDVRSIKCHCELQAGIDPLSIDEDRARTALTVIAAFLGAGELEIASEEVKQCGPWREFDQVARPVNGQFDGTENRVREGLVLVHDLFSADAVKRQTVKNTIRSIPYARSDPAGARRNIRFCDSVCASRAARRQQREFPLMPAAKRPPSAA